MPYRRQKNVHREVTRHGQVVYYFKKPGCARIRLPSIDHPDFFDRLSAARDGRLVDVRDMPVTPLELRKQRVEIAMRSCFRAARTRSRKKSVPFDISLDWLLDVAEEQGFRCKLTGIEFYAKPPARGKIDPYAPSLDRIVPARGYTRDNVRIVLRAVNTMLLDWGHEVFEQVTNSYRHQQRNKRRISIFAPSVLAFAPEKQGKEIKCLQS